MASSKTPGSGRKRGTPNKKTQELKDIAERLGVDPFEVLLLFASGNWKKLGYDCEKYTAGINEFGSWDKWTIDPGVRAKAAAEACQYLHPKRKAIEVTGKDGEPLSFVTLVQKFAGEDGSGGT